VANEKHVEILRSGVEVWNGWRKQNPKVIPDLRRADLRRTDLRQAGLRRAALIEANLSGSRLISADLSGANLSGANLSGANLSQANLSRADLSRANLFRADLGAAVLRQADLTRANLSEADLISADLSKAALLAANLTSTRLRDTNLAKSYFGRTSCVAISLNGLIGVSLIEHFYESFITIDTLERTAADLGTDASKEHEIELFLEGAGVPGEYIEFFRSRIGQPIQFYSCFISYSTKDQAFADRLYADLRQSGVRCWLATEDLKIGDKFRARINDAIRFHDKLVVVLSEQSVKSAWVEEELEAAFEKERTNGGTVLFPIRLDDAVMECDEAWAASIRRIRHIGDFRRWKDHDEYAKSLDRLIRDLRPERTSKAAPAPE
jgi:hypothetical protein